MSQTEVQLIKDSAVVTADIADQAVTLDKLPHGTGSNDGKFLRANNGADPTFETVTSTTINTNADNRVITGSGTANTLNGEANLTFDGANLLLNSTSGNVLFGETTAYNTFENSSTNPRLQVRGTNLNGSCQAWIRATADGGAPKLFIANTRNTSSNGHTIVQSNDELGGLFFAGSDGSQFVNGASISAIVNGTPGADDVPGALLFGTNAGAASTTERMRIMPNGNVGINQTNPQAKFNVTVGTNINFQVSNTNARVERSFSGGSSTDEDGMWFVDNDSTTGTYIRFWQTVGGAHQIGSISHSTSSTSYNTSSDYRLKENIISISDGITRLKTLKPSRFNFIGESEIVDGFIAHEVTAVPESITGTKDEVAETDAPELGLKKGDPIYQGIDQSKLVPLLTAALQEAVTKIEILETKVAALEAA